MARPTLWHGELTSRGRLLRRGLALAAGGTLWLLVFLILPSLVVVGLAFTKRAPYGQIELDFTLENFKRLIGFGVFGFSGDNFRILARSLGVAAVTTILSLAIAYPMAFFIAGRGRRWRWILLAAVTIPMCTNLVIRTYAWELLLSPQLPPARLAAWLGLVEAGRPLYPGPLAVCLGMVSTALPLAVLPLYTNVEKLDWSLVEAARDLYASRTRTFLRIILPQTWPGLRVAVILTFVPAVGMFVVTDRLGGANFWLVGNLIQQQFGPSMDIPYGAAVSIVLIALTLAAVWLYQRPGRPLDLM